MTAFSIGEVCSLGCALLWALAVLLFRKSGELLPPIALNCFKGAVAISCFAITLPFLGIELSPPGCGLREWLVLLASGAIGIGVADSLFFASLNRLGAGGSAIVGSTYSPFVLLLASFYLGEPLRAGLLVAVTLMVSAIVLLNWEPQVVAAARKQRRDGVLLGLSSMALMATGIVLAKPVLNISPVMWATPVRLVGGEVVVLMYLLSARQRPAILRAFRPSRLWLLTVPSGLLGSYLAMLVWIAGMKYAPASVAGILNQTSTLFLPLLAAIFLKERLSVAKILAVLLGFSGALVAAL